MSGCRDPKTLLETVVLDCRLPGEWVPRSKIDSQTAKSKSVDSQVRRCLVAEIQDRSLEPVDSKTVHSETADSNEVAEIQNRPLATIDSQTLDSHVIAEIRDRSRENADS